VDAAWERAVARSAALDSSPDDWSQPAVIYASSGTTGLPKFTILSHLQVYCRAWQSIFNEAPRPRRNLSTVPLYFGAGRDNAQFSLLRCDTLVLQPSLFRAAEFVEAVRAHHINNALVVPAVVRQLLQVAGSGECLLPTMNLMKSSGAPLFAEE